MVALYGDSVSRIVPVNYPTRKTKTVAALAEHGFIRDIAPHEAGDTPAQTFSTFLAEYQELLRPTYSVDKTQPWGSDPDDRHLEDEAVTKRAYVEASKFSGVEIRFSGEHRTRRRGSGRRRELGGHAPEAREPVHDAAGQQDRPAPEGPSPERRLRVPPRQRSRVFTRRHAEGAAPGTLHEGGAATGRTAKCTVHAGNVCL